ncbi:MAG: DUF3794 domain-containing protein, partial [Oscillospiraceae bacterium]|nr:DUF3794 domain-containing protein [Oscillospiraceae bacterium]
IPGKVVFKGELCVDALLKTPEDPEPLTHVELSVPFSGVADCETADTDAEIAASCRCVDAELTTEEEVGTGRGMMRIRAGIAVETVCERTVSAGVVTDAYSRTMTLKTGFEKLSLRCRPERRTVRIELRETVGTGTGIASVYGVSAEIAGAEIRDGTAAAGVAVGVLFRGEDGTVGRAARTLQGEAEAGPEEGLCVSGARVTGKSYRIASADEVEVRVSVELELEVRRETATASLCLAEASEPAETGRRPSLTLCGALAGEDWWDLGKRMGAGVGEILAANGLDGTEPPDGRMLLIPRGGPRGGSERGSGRV